MTCIKNNLRLVRILFSLATGITTSFASTNGFLVPQIRNLSNSQFGYWENFTVPSGVPGNVPDQPGTLTNAVLFQSNPSAIIAGSGNLYNPGAASSFTLTNNAPYLLSTVVLQIRTAGNELDYDSVLMTYSDTNGNHSLLPLFRYELNRSTIPGQGANVSSLWQFDFTGIQSSNFGIAFKAAASSLSLDAITLDTAGSVGASFLDRAAFTQQPFKLQSSPAVLARWMYPFNGSPANRQTASVFGSLGSAPDFDSRDAQFLLGWNTKDRIPAGQGASNYLVRRVRVTLTISGGNQYTYTGTLRDYRSYLPSSDSRFVAATNTSSPVELFGAGFRGGFTNEENSYVAYTALNYPQDGPFFVDPSAGYRSNRVAYAAAFDTNGVMVDVSNNVGDNGSAELPNPFEIAPFAVGKTTNVVEGQLMPANSQLTFDLNLDDPQIYNYVQSGLDQGNLSFIAGSLVSASFSGPPSYPSFYTIFSSLALSNQFPLLDIEGEVVRAGVDSDGDGLPDDWENFYFGSLSQSATADPDGDGLNNLSEYLAGTIPTSYASCLRVHSLRHESNQFTLRFSSALNRQYVIQQSSDLRNWQTVINPALGYSSAWLEKDGTNATYPSEVYGLWHDTNTLNSAHFYRVGAQ